MGRTGKEAEVARPLVLVLEDNQDLLEFYSLVLEDAGYGVVGAAEGGTGLQLAQDLRPDAVVLDMMMPDVDGLAFLERLRSRAHRPPVLANSGFEGFRSEALRRGADAFLRKPVAPELLLETLQRLLRSALPRPQPEMNQQAADRARDAFWASLEHELPRLCHTLSLFVDWLAGFYGFGRSWIDFLAKGTVHVAAGDAAGARFSGARLPFCSDVIEAGSTLLIEDAAHHPVFANHAAVTTLGTRFYAGVPIAVGSLSVATLCLFDAVPREFHIEDMRLLEHFGREIASQLSAAAEHRPAHPPFFTPPCLFQRPTLHALLTRLEGTLARGGGAVAVALAELAGESAEACALALRNVWADGRHALTRARPGALAFLAHGADGPVMRAQAALARSVLRGRGVSPWAEFLIDGEALPPATWLTETLEGELAAERAREAGLLGDEHPPQ